MGFNDLPGEVQQAIMAMRESAAGNAAWQNLVKSVWKEPTPGAETAASELEADCVAARVTGLPMNPGVKCP
ncbi:hypothetical protein GCM10012319_71480 [Comamonas sp. KCTC 72670]|nr:hypothetical protein GCM10012319_71480 [Comamonas sp. KCTC 72670]